MYKFQFFLILNLLLLLNASAQSGAEETMVTQLPITLNVSEIKIKDKRDVDNDGEFHFWRRIMEKSVRLPAQGEIVRKKNEFIYPTEPGLAAEPFWEFSWQENGTNSRRIEFDAYEHDTWPDEDDYLGIVRTTLDLTTFEFIDLHTNRKLETDDFHIIFSVISAPAVNSTTHADSTQIYEKPVLSLTWQSIMPAIGILGYSYQLDENASSIPDNQLEGTHTAKEYYLTPATESYTYWFHLRAFDKAGFWSSTTHFRINTGNFRFEETTRIVDPGNLPESGFRISAYPNPFNAQTQISYTLNAAANVEILIFNIKGQLVRQLLQQSQQPGQYQLSWDARTDDGKSLPSGIYLVVLRAGKVFRTQKITLIR